jgi:hypothetical protein
LSRKPQPLVDLAQDQARDRAVLVGELERAIHSIARLALNAVNSWIGIPPTLTARDSGRSRAPSHSGHGRIDMYSSIFSRDQSESVSL